MKGEHVGKILKIYQVLVREVKSASYLCTNFDNERKFGFVD
jgi:hypothetical protein